MPATLSHKFKFITPHVPRTGGTSITDAVRPHLGPRDITDEQLEKHQSLRIIRIGHPKEFEEYVKFAVVRHPFDRIYSLFNGFNVNEPGATFEGVIDRLWTGNGDWNPRKFAFFWPAQRWLCDDDGKNLCDRIFKFEDGFGPVVEFLQGLGIPLKKLPHVNEGPGNGKREYYAKAMESVSAETMEKFRKLYAWDYENLGYDNQV